MALDVGSLVASKYRLERQIGAGGMGAVWLAKNEALGGTRVAVKFMLNAMNKSAVDRFQREAHLASRIKSRHAVQVLDYGIEPDGNVPYIAMEYLEGEDLRHLLDRQKRLEPQLLASIVDQASRGLQKAHEAGLVHRDIKPENLFLCRDEDGSMLVKVLDFGIAKSLDAASGTATGTVIGTAYYMSPEQFLGSRALDHRTDLWSLACVVYESFVGEPPFTADSVVAIGMKVASAERPVPTSVAPGVPGVTPAFDAWMARALHPQISERFTSARELSVSLAAALGAAPTSQQPTLAFPAGSRSTEVEAFAPTQQPFATTAAASMSATGLRATQGTRRVWPWVGVGGAVLAAGVAAFALRTPTATPSVPGAGPPTQAAARIDEVPAPAAASTVTVAPVAESVTPASSASATPSARPASPLTAGGRRVAAEPAKAAPATPPPAVPVAPPPAALPQRF